MHENRPAELDLTDRVARRRQADVAGELELLARAGHAEAKPVVRRVVEEAGVVLGVHARGAGEYHRALRERGAGAGAAVRDRDGASEAGGAQVCQAGAVTVEDVAGDIAGRADGEVRRPAQRRHGEARSARAGADGRADRRFDGLGRRGDGVPRHCGGCRSLGGRGAGFRRQQGERRRLRPPGLGAVAEDGEPPGVGRAGCEALGEGRCPRGRGAREVDGERRAGLLRFATVEPVDHEAQRRRARRRRPRERRAAAFDLGCAAGRSRRDREWRGRVGQCPSVVGRGLAECRRRRKPRNADDCESCHGPFHGRLLARAQIRILATASRHNRQPVSAGQDFAELVQQQSSQR